MVTEPLGRLRWHCRRGMRELDLLLENFLDCDYPSLVPAQQASFVKLLDQQDADLYAWFTGRGLPDDPALVKIVEAVVQRSQAPNR